VVPTEKSGKEGVGDFWDAVIPTEKGRKETLDKYFMD
jgi:hypothetical protein